MESDLSNRVQGVPERFEPASMHGELTEAEHLVRYAWASRLAPGRRVLDAGCGVGYGAKMLRRHGAAEVIGVDLAESVIEVAGAEEEAGLEFEVGDIGNLDFEDGRFDLVVCLEVIEHVHDQRRVIGELVRVLAPAGVLVVSSPNRAAYVPGNPHHVHEYMPEELRAALAESLEHVKLWRQHNWLCSAVLDDEAFVSDDTRPVRDLWAEKVVGQTPGSETYTLALASDAPLPEPAPGAVITGMAEVRKWMDLYDQQQEILDGQHESFRLMEDRSAELADLRARLAEAERSLARVVAIEQERDEALGTLARVFDSPSWRITSPLRTLKRILKLLRQSSRA